MNKFVFTCGDTNGIGPEIAFKTLNRVFTNLQAKYYFVCPKNIFDEVSRLIPPKFEFEITKSKKPSHNKIVTVIDTGVVKFTPGKPTKHSGKAAFKAIRAAYELLTNNSADAMVTSPISKTAINMAGYNYPGHTEMIAEWVRAKDYVMMFLSREMNAALVTIHEPIKKVSSILSRKVLSSKIDIIISSLMKDLHIHEPKAAVLGLNPHAGEEGLIGKEEKKIIKPVMESSEFAQYLHGPFSPDAFFAKNLYKQYDVVIGMYHDQVLIPFKLLNFSSGVNFTAGLSIVRTSPDHGTAYDIAMKNQADENSFLEAFLYAERIVKNRKPLLL